MIIIHDECWIFPCNRWLADYEDDGKTERDLYAGELGTTKRISIGVLYLKYLLVFAGEGVRKRCFPPPLSHDSLRSVTVCACLAIAHTKLNLQLCVKGFSSLLYSRSLYFSRSLYGARRFGMRDAEGLVRKEIGTRHGCLSPQSLLVDTTTYASTFIGITHS